MSDEKRDLKKAVQTRRRKALSMLEPQWRRCVRQRPFGHIRDGSTPEEVVRVHRLYESVCLFCGAPKFPDILAIERLEGHARIADRYPIARQVPKRAGVPA